MWRKSGRHFRDQPAQGDRGDPALPRILGPRATPLPRTTDPFRPLKIPVRMLEGSLRSSLGRWLPQRVLLEDSQSRF